MARAIKGRLYCIKRYGGSRHYVECDNEDELMRYAAEFYSKGNIITSVVRMDADGSTPKVPVLTDKRYKAHLKELMDQ